MFLRGIFHLFYATYLCKSHLLEGKPKNTANSGEGIVLEKLIVSQLLKKLFRNPKFRCCSHRILLLNRMQSVPMHPISLKQNIGYQLKNLTRALTPFTCPSKKTPT
jgi:hypothetical protein